MGGRCKRIPITQERGAVARKSRLHKNGVEMVEMMMHVFMQLDPPLTIIFRLTPTRYQTILVRQSPVLPRATPLAEVVLQPLDHLLSRQLLVLVAVLVFQIVEGAVGGLLRLTVSAQLPPVRGRGSNVTRRIFPRR